MMASLQPTLRSICFHLAATVLVLCLQTSAQDAQAPAALSVGNNACLRANNCSLCMQSGSSCSWCKTKEFVKNRCNTRQGLIEAGCAEPDIINEQPQRLSVKDDPVSDGSATAGSVQLSPQRLQVKLRPNQPYQFNLSFRLAKDYPVDLYYLMDLSQSMQDDKEKLSSLGLKLVAEMRNITRDVRLGFGSFVDKVAMPYVNMMPSQLLAPCLGCESPYSFRNRLSLTDQVSQFGPKVNATPVSGNQDSPEGGFDAIVQAVKCNDQIGWRNNSRKMLLFSSDASFHSAGDGKLGGIVEPNDGECHMSNNEYTWALKQDYPSISQLGSIIKEHRINVIFAVAKDQEPRYQQLSEYLDGSVSGVLEEDSSNIVQLVRDNFQRIASRVEMKTRGLDVDSGLSISMRSSCGNDSIATQLVSACDKLGPGEQVTFEVELLAQACAGRRQWQEKFEIYPVGLSESLQITADVICECTSCNDLVMNSPYCNKTGTFQCGVCSCDAGFEGERCECNLKELRMDAEGLEAACIAPNMTAAAAFETGKCTGRGDCLCGKCRCGCRPGTENLGDSCERYAGQWCQCDVYNCQRGDNDQLCSGNGKCICDESTGKVGCSCYPGYNGSSCDCALSDIGCRVSNTSTEVCSGHGRCTCGRCECLPDEAGNFYRGVHCEDCATCEGKCTEFKQCVLCRAFNSGTLKDQCSKKCNHTFYLVDQIPLNEKYKCIDRDDFDCTIEYSYSYRSSGYILFVKETRDCPKEVNILAVVLGVIGGILFLGLAALLIWKLITTIHDRREFARFEKERQSANWGAGENPIYVKATSTFKNPMYGGGAQST